MKKSRFIPFVLILGALVLSACGASAGASTPAPVATGGSAKVEAMPVAFIGIVDSITGDQWVISGTTVTVDEAVVRDGPFNAGDQVKVEGLVHPDGSVTISRVESPGLKATATLPSVSDDNSNESTVNANTNDSNVNDTNSNDGSSDDNSNGVNSNDDNSNDVNGSNSNDANSNDDDGSNSNDDNSNDDNGSNSNDDNSNDDNGSNSNDNNSNDDNSGNSNDD